MFLVFGHAPDHQRQGQAGVGLRPRDLPQIEDPHGRMDGFGWWAIGECPAFSDRAPRDYDIRGHFQR